MPRAWTDGFVPILLLGVLTAAFSCIAVMDGSGLVWAELLVVGCVITTPVWAGAAGGLVVGLAGAAAHVGLHSINGDWGGNGAAFSVVAVCTFIAYGWLFGLTTAHLRRKQEADSRQPATVGAGHSQGLLSATEGRALFNLEVDQARRSGNNLAALIVTVTVREGIRPQQAARAFRAAARTFEAASSGNRHPVLLSGNQLAMLIPGGELQDGYLFEQALLSAIGEATYADRDAGTRPKASTALRLDSRFVVVTESPANAEVLFRRPERRLTRTTDYSAVSTKTAA